MLVWGVGLDLDLGLGLGEEGLLALDDLDGHRLVLPTHLHPFDARGLHHLAKRPLADQRPDLVLSRFDESHP